MYLWIYHRVLFHDMVRCTDGGDIEPRGWEHLVHDGGVEIAWRKGLVQIQSLESKANFFQRSVVVSRCVSDIFQNKNCRACRFLPPLFKKICLIVFNSIEVLQTVDDDLGLIL